MSALQQWGAAEKIEAMCFDTTAVNTGSLKGACIILQQLLEKDLLYLACRHHVLELVLKEVFLCKMGKTNAPQPDIFREFQKEWSKFDKTKFKTVQADEHIFKKINQLDKISQFLQHELKNRHPRDDYKEFIHLCLIYLGQLPSDKISFRIPGAIHHARWMAKAIYCLKIYLFRDQFTMTKPLKKSIEDICLFIVNVYVKAWFNAPKPNIAPNQDLQLLKALVDYKKIDKDIADNALSKFSNHLWYLNPEQIGLSFFDDDLERTVKIRMINNLNSGKDKDGPNPSDRVVKAKLDSLEIHGILNKDVDYFVSSRTLNFFRRFDINTDFLDSDPDLWGDDPHYLRGKKIVNGLRVVNDTAERGVKLIQDFNTFLTKDEQQRQCLLQVVSECRNLFPDTLKATISKPLPP